MATRIKYSAFVGKFVLLINLTVATPTFATHILGGYISYRAVDNQTYDITVHILTDPESDTPAIGVLNLGDGTTQEIMATTDAIDSSTNLSTFTIRHRYDSAGTYEISYTEQNYTGEMNNVGNSSSTPFFIASQLVVSSQIAANSSPVLQLYQRLWGGLNQTQRINPAPWDPDQDSLSYQLIVPRQALETPIPEYVHLNDSAFYTNYSTGNQAGNSSPAYSINPSTGEILWDAPGTVGLYAIAYQITQWRKITGTWTPIGSTEVVLMDYIIDAPATVTIDLPASVCFDRSEDVQAQFAVETSSEEALSVQIFSDLPGGQINTTAIPPGSVKDSTFVRTLEVAVSLSPDAEVPLYRPYRIIVLVVTPERTYTASWAFALGCSRLPDNIAPEPVEPTVSLVACNQFLIYPNPAIEDYVQACLPENSDQPRTISIIDGTGKVVYHWSAALTESVVRFSTEGLRPGMYVLQIDQYTGKFLVTL